MSLSTIELTVFILITILAISLIFNIATLFDNNRKSREKKAKIVKTEKVVQQPLTNRRRSFRINFMEENKSCFVKVNKMGDEVLEESIEGEARLVDISGTGTRLMFSEDLPVRKRISISVEFELEDEKFKINGELVRKMETLKDSKVVYGMDFRDVPITDENRLIRIIMSISRDKKRALINRRPEVKRTIIK
jgi:c-di-GMP-binding flagellar brake protein YcgR